MKTLKHITHLAISITLVVLIITCNKAKAQTVDTVTNKGKTSGSIVFFGTPKVATSANIRYITDTCRCGTAMQVKHEYIKTPLDTMTKEISALTGGLTFTSPNWSNLPIFYWKPLGKTGKQMLTAEYGYFKLINSHTVVFIPYKKESLKHKSK